MSRPILVGHDPSSSELAPVEWAAAAARFTGAPLIVAAVHADPGALDGLGHVETELGLPADGTEASLPGGLELRSLPGTSAPGALHTAAEELGAGLVVVGSSRRGRVGRLMRGSTAERLLHGAPCPVAVVPKGWQVRGRIETIGVAYADRPEGHEALRGAVVLARRAGARLRVLTAAEPHGFSQTQGGGSMTEATTFAEVGSALRVCAERAVDAATADVRGVEVESDVSVQDPADFLIAASGGLDLLVCGSRGYGPHRAVLLGGVTRRVTAEAQCPVIVLARGVEAALEDLVGETAGATA